MWKESKISSCLSNAFLLNQLHDSVMNKVFEVASVRLNKGNPPCSYSWFVTGSSGRYEQGLISDQDHGIIFEIASPKNEEYFLELGKEISDGLDVVGYPYCQGNVMSSNPLWCQSFEQWRAQLFVWMEKNSWDTIRNLQIFYDARHLHGTDRYVDELKSFIYTYQKKHPMLLKRFMENVMHIKRSVGPFGQIIVEEHGEHQGSINLKYAVFLPYVNAIRILAIKEGLTETSTLARIDQLSQIKTYSEMLQSVKSNFQKLLDYRLSLTHIQSYKDTHFLNMKNLDSQGKKEIKRILKDGKKLHYYVCRLVEKGCE
nr:DUF294 nucleotidyltransferase-like domain-containing protein [Ammoniphilus resinae]